jgi:hypothetical protein
MLVSDAEVYARIPWPIAQNLRSDQAQQRMWLSRLGCHLLNSVRGAIPEKSSAASATQSLVDCTGLRDS